MALGKKDWFNLNPKLVYLTHGTFGASLKSALDNKIEWQKKLESDPFDFLINEAPKELANSRNHLAKYINCNGDDLVYFPNPSTALNAVIKSLNLKKNDEVLTTNHEYGALDRTWKYYSNFKGYNYKKVKIEVPYNDKSIFIKKFESAINTNTKVIYLSHITSSTGLIFPVKEICEIAKNNNILSIVDGAHVPGHINLDINDIDSDVYVGACHKWMCSPKGVAFLYVKKQYQDMLEPLVVSWGYEAEYPSDSQFLDYMQWQGTNDISAYLTIPDTIKFLKKHDWKKKAQHCRALNLWAKNEICTALDTYATGADQFLGQMTTIAFKLEEPLKEQIDFYTKYKIQLPFIKWNDKTFFRISLQVYNSKEDINYLIKSLLQYRASK
jgi:isopenicillin-N epimerase